MRNVTRTPKPACLTNNGRRWCTEYLEAIENGDSVQIKQRRRKYNHPVVRGELNKMYRNLCCYCEGQVGPVGADQIEHRMPVEKFPERTFEWENMHISCTRCNRVKSDQWNPQHPILDAVTDVPITNHLDYKSARTGVRRVWLTDPGHTTVKHADLNREKLREARREVMSEVVGLIQEIKRLIICDPDDPLAANRREELEEMYAGPYGSMIRWAVDTLLS